jgi:hypothetical protein
MISDLCDLAGFAVLDVAARTLFGWGVCEALAGVELLVVGWALSAPRPPRQRPLPGKLGRARRRAPMVPSAALTNEQLDRSLADGHRNGKPRQDA